MAFIKRRGYDIPEVVRAICLDVLRHRIAVTYEAEAEEITTEYVIQEILNKIEVPQSIPSLSKGKGQLLKKKKLNLVMDKILTIYLKFDQGCTLSFGLGRGGAYAY